MREQELKAQYVLYVHFKLSEWKRFLGLLIVPHINRTTFFVHYLIEDDILKNSLSLLRFFCFVFLQPPFLDGL